MQKENEAKKRKSINRKKNTGNNENFVNLKLFDINRKKRNTGKLCVKKKKREKCQKGMKERKRKTKDETEFVTCRKITLGSK